jgi:hypothetical protein
MFLLCSRITAQNAIEGTTTDTIEFFSEQLIMSYPAQYKIKKSNISFGGIGIVFSSSPPLSFISIIEAANTELVFGDDCEELIKYEMVDRVVHKGFCPLKGYYRVDFFKASNIKVSYQVVPSCELEEFNAYLDSAILIKK